MANTNTTDCRAGDIASLLINSKCLVVEWERFYHHLNLLQDKSHEISLKFNQDPQSFVLMKTIIQQWTSEKAEGATVQALGNVLTTLNHVEIKNELLSKFDPSTRICTLTLPPTIAYETVSSLPTDIVAQDRNLASAEEGKFANDDLKKKTSGETAITILELLKIENQPNKRIFIFISPLLNMLTRLGDIPVVIVSINGKQRMGKSFMATQFIKYLKFCGLEENAWLDEELESSFKWSGQHDRVTSGIQMWSEPIIVNCGNKNIGVIVMDTQGLYDRNTGTQENASIFGLSVLLSSVFIFNEKSLAEDCFNYLNSFLEFAKYASANGQADDTSQRDMQIKFQKLIVLLRDYQAYEFQHGYYSDNSTPPGQTENLKSKLFTIKSDDDEEARRTRLGIKNSFDDILVYAMPTPGNRLPDKPNYRLSSSWDSEFRTSVIDFVSSTFSPSCLEHSTKKILGMEVTALELSQYVSCWAKLISETVDLVKFRTMFEATADIFYSGKIETCVEKYKTTMRKYIRDNPGGVDETVYKAYNDSQVVSLESEFCEGAAYGGHEMLDLYKPQIREKILGFNQEFADINQSNVVAEQERVETELQKNELEKQREDAKKFAIAGATSNLQQRQQDLALARQKREHIVANQSTYKKGIQKTQNHRILGIKVKGDKYVEWVYDADAYNAALHQVDVEVQLHEERCANAESQLVFAQNI